MRQKLLAAAAFSAAALLAGSASLTTAGSAAGADDGRADRAARQSVADQLLRAGLQTARKHTTLPTVKVGGKTVNAANPYLAEIADPTTVDWSYWNRLMERRGEKRAAAQKAAVPTPFVYDELEPAGEFGSNDTQANAEQITKFGLAKGKKNAVRVLGELSPPAIATDDIETEEDQGSIPLATDTGIPATTDGVTVSSEIGDGPHGSTGTGNGDFDFYALSATAGEVLRADTMGSELDTLLVIYDATGTIVAANDDSEGTLQSQLAYKIPADGDYYVMVSGFTFFGGIPEDPFDSASGTGFGDEGTYDLTTTVGPADHDYYTVRLRPGDVLAGPSPVARPTSSWTSSTVRRGSARRRISRRSTHRSHRFRAAATA